ncbi:phenylacetaldehyde dehydrogenase [Agrococcus baldri]|uniref:Phenylacetaldehyde dehydrogenase n=1 Tax=Agrococcus baldri TaxID=153730 RepID=A0AA94HN56_9MICO|nr:aldehyde dehydrogenase family protein [Agrococcus baldri]SFS14874.1 phenylacetaldehyde dehydrogenase [Agrococcus baldri]
METYESLLAAVSVPEGQPVIDPATGEAFAHAPVSTTADLERAIAAAQAAQPAWAALSDDERRAALTAAADEIEANAEALALIIAREQGKPLSGPGARFEVGAVVGWLRATVATQLEPEVVVDDEQAKATIYYRPIGLVGAIGPWNWPAMIATWQFAPALRMGNAVVMKPSEFTPLSVLATALLVNRHLPEGLFTVLAGDRELGEAISSNPAFGKVTFTGSARTGAAIMRASADNLTRLTLELGGNDPGIVLPDVDPKAIAEGLFWGAFINTGQTCAALKRLYVHEDVYDDVVRELAAVAGAMPMGPGSDEQNVLGPLTTEQQFGIVDRLVEDAKARGGRVLVGGEPDRDAPGWFYPATLVDGLDDDADLVKEEQFGPALPILKYSDVDDAIERANRGEAGLGASVWSADPARAREVASRIQSGSVWINSHGTIHPMAPFGGVKGSGYGLEFGVEGLKAMGVPQVIHG